MRGSYPAHAERGERNALPVDLEVIGLGFEISISLVQANESRRGDALDRLVQFLPSRDLMLRAWPEPIKCRG